MPTQPKRLKKTISVIIPCYGYAHFLSDCVESVVNQTVKADEIVIVNDGSKDNTSDVAQELIEKYPNENIILVEKENGGLSSARNAGIKVSKSQFLMCLDSDDMLRPDSLKVYKGLADEKSIVQAGLLYFGLQVATFRPTGATLESLLRSNSIYCNSVFPRSAWEKVKYDESDTMRLGLEDWLYWIELMAHGYTLKTSDYISLLYRRHGNAMTQATTHPRWNEITSFMKDKVKRVYNLDSNFHTIRPSV